MATLLIILTLLFAMMLPRGTNVPYSNPPRIVKKLIIANLAIHCVTQAVEWMSLHDTSATSLIRQYYDVFALTPIKLEQGEDWRWMQLITANFIHGSWSHVIFNLWFFYIYAVNLEDFFGPRKFIIFMVSSMLASQLAIVFLSQGTAAYNMPHLGFSGVVYAAMAAYLVIYPRSKIQVVLIYDILFWLRVIIGLGFLCAIAYWYVRSLSELLWIAGFVFLFINTAPGHISFGVPALLFLGYRFARDWVGLEDQINATSISAWGHAGGFMAGAVAGLFMNGTKGFSQTYGDEDDLKKRKPKRTRDDEEKLQAAVASSGIAAARAYLGQRVFTGDGVAATDFYLNSVLPKFPDLALDPREQLSLARMLEIRGFPEQSLHAYDIYMKHEGGSAGPADAYLRAAALCKSNPQRIPDGLRYLQRLDDFEILNREKLEARQLREELLAIAAENGIEIEPAILNAGSPTGWDGQGGWENKRAATEATPLALRTSRMKQLQPDRDASKPPPLPASATQDIGALGGKKPLPLKSLNRGKKPDPSVESLNDEPKPDLPASPAPYAEPIILPHTVSSSETGSSDRISLSSQKPLFLDSNTPPGNPIIPLEGESVHGEHAPAREEPLLAPATETKAPKPPAPPGPTWAVILADGASINSAALQAIMSVHLDGPAQAERAIAEGKGILVRGLPEADARALSAELSARQVTSLAVAEDHPALDKEPFDLVSLELQHGEIIATYATGRARCQAADVQALTYSLVKLSPHSKSFRRCLEIVPASLQRRLSVWDHTVNHSSCKIDGVPVNPEFALEELFLALAARVPDAALTHAARHALRAPEEIVQFTTFQAYENYIAFCILSKSPRK